MTFKLVGYFRELHHDPDLPSIRAAVRSTRHTDEAWIVAYLNAGICLFACGIDQGDVLNPSSGVGTSPHTMSDGVWQWPGELPYYVSVYGVELPMEFVDHMRQNGWAVPVEKEELFDRLGWK